MGAATIAGTYCDVGHSQSVRHLRDALAPRIIHYGLDDLDAGDLRRRAPRRLTQEISRYVFALADASGRAAFQGIRYASRLGDDLANWAIFEPNEPTALSSADIDEDGRPPSSLVSEGRP